MHLEQTSSKEIHSFIWSKHKNSKSHTVLAGATPLFGDRFSKRSRHQQSWSLLPVRIINTLGHSPFRQKQTTVLEEVAPPAGVGITSPGDPPCHRSQKLAPGGWLSPQRTAAFTRRQTSPRPGKKRANVPVLRAALNTCCDRSSRRRSRSLPAAISLCFVGDNSHLFHLIGHRLKSIEPCRNHFHVCGLIGQ